jgi:hypothetical protein
LQVAELKGNKRKFKEDFGRKRKRKVEFKMPLTQRVSFKKMLKKENRIPVPKLVRR